MNVSDFEKAVFELEDVRIVIRAPANTEVGDYNYQRAASGTASVSEWLATRIADLVGQFKAVVVDGTGVTPHGRTRMATLRGSYES